MQELIQKIEHEGEHVGGGIVKVDSFLNHQVDPALTRRMAKEMSERFRAAGVGQITRVLTAEVSGIPVALEVAGQFGALLIYARKSQSRIMTGTYYVAEAISRTHGTSSDLMVDRRFLGSQDSVLIVDDFLATGATLSALAKLVSESGARLCGIGCVIEKPAEGGRDALGSMDAPVITLAKILFEDGGLRVVP
ncbi:MAG: xanthine phosphoribosyltransferase [Acidiferrobacteraceae bacterium]|nr:xanthine phosphoribosyltransferase [Acidiferrobacteraceae bacterium]